MTQEEKQLLLQDICARLPYNVLVHIYDIDVCDYDNYLCEDDLAKFRINSIQIKPYLRPMSSMTEEEFKELTIVTELQYDQLELMDWGDGVKTLEFYIEEIPHYCVIKVFDWLNEHHFDYRGLIEKGLALEAPKDMY